MGEGRRPPHQRLVVRRPWWHRAPFPPPAAGRRRKPFRRSWGVELMHLAHYLGLVHRSEQELASSFREVASAHGDEPDVSVLCQKFAVQCDQHAAKLMPFVDRYGEEAPQEPERLHSDLFGGTRTGGSACCAICTTCTSWPAKSISPGRWSGRRPRAPVTKRCWRR